MGIKRNRIVVKVGTSTLTNDLGKSNLRKFEDLALTLSDIQNMGHEIVLVSSGAIAVGAQKMHLTERPKEMRMMQAAAAVGQCENMFLYDKYIAYYNKTVPQNLRNADDIADEEKKENLANTF
ncbi:MAG: glutamate 5-kinase, partial [Clostridiales bacterium]|nr:glutamate 5-kinase [Clostridiales bacterium]